ncbi:M23 family metallopeptidase [Bradyrhizobium sp. CCBAU 51765]|uniref:M23 family metallopeptidase n=1 Tax=Bradyrhizobium sp. CCBAU 51765 TaxID=1325102 RepID=UPI001FEF3317|nr:M23 family metallopeptidase [Bradyrhizobium sp. CCBAU 51765]
MFWAFKMTPTRPLAAISSPISPVIVALVLAGPGNALAERIQLGIPIACEPGRTCYIQNYTDRDPSPAARDYKCGTLTYDGHNGTDFRLPSLQAQRVGVDVLAAAKGRVVRTRENLPDGAFQKAARDAVRDVECGNGVLVEHEDHWETQYCHLATGSLRVKLGDSVTRGQPLGRVGLSGLTEYPHLHFTVRHNGSIIDPFAYGSDSCGAGEMLWDPALQAPLRYQERAVLNTGFATAPVTMESIEDGGVDAELPSATSSAIVAFVRIIGLKSGDLQRLVVSSPSGKVIAENNAAPVEHNKAQAFLFTGRKRPANGWDPGTYQAEYTVEHAGQVVLREFWELPLQSH